MERKEKKGKGLIKFLFFIAIICLVLGGLLTFLTSPKYVIENTLKTASTNAIEMYNKQQETGLTENYKKEGKLRIDLKSDYYTGLSTMNEEYQSISKVLENLSNTETDYTIIHDKKNQKRLIHIDTKLKDTPLLNAKHLIDNATEYYYIEGITPTYINNGNNNYFESLSTTTSKENIEYLLTRLAEITSNNIDENTISTSYDTSHKIITITLTEKDLLTLENKILKDLKNDDRANTILTGYNPDFEKMKITQEDIKGTKTITVNIYVDKVFSQVNKVEINNKDNTYTYTKENNREIYTYKTKEQAVNFIVQKNDKRTEIEITNEDDENIGNITITQTDTNYDVLAEINIEDTSYSIGYNHQLTNLKVGKSYDSTTSISMKVTSNETTLIDGLVVLEQKTSNDTKITEDTSTSTLASSLDNSIDDLLAQKMTTVIMTLLS